MLGAGPEANRCARALAAAAGAGPLLVSSVAGAELAAASTDPAKRGATLGEMHIAIEEAFPMVAAERAAIAWKLYTAARRGQAARYHCQACGREITAFACPGCGQAMPGGPRHLLADFLIAAHAVVAGARLLTLERRGGRYRRYFPELLVLTLDEVLSP